MNSYFALPGFLGSSSDFAKVKDALAGSWVFPQWPPCIDKNEDMAWKAWTADQITRLKSQSFQNGLIGIGYSLGARLLAELACVAPDLFRIIILLSWNSERVGGVSTEDRFAADRDWARRLETDAWSEFLTAWNAQAAFSGSSPHIGAEPTHTEKAEWSKVLNGFSLARQIPQLTRLFEAKQNFYVFVGESDTKLLHSTAIQKVKAAGRLYIIPAAGHRLLLDAPQNLTDTISRLI
jgi:pimeloyl-ACP methyl ester carboxylesterase